MPRAGYGRHSHPVANRNSAHLLRTDHKTSTWGLSTQGTVQLQTTSYKKDLKSPCFSSMLPCDLHRSISHTRTGEHNTAATISSQVATSLGQESQGNSSHSPSSVLEETTPANTSSKRKGMENTNDTWTARPCLFTFRGLQAGLLTQVQQSRNTRCLLPSGITPELISPVIRAGSQHSGAGSLMQANGGWPWKEPVWVWGLLAQALHHTKEYKVALEAK